MANKVEIDLTPYFIGYNIIKEPATKVFVETKEFQKNWKQGGRLVDLRRKDIQCAGRIQPA